MIYEIVYGSRAVWVNDPYGCLGRFGVMGIDVHNDIPAQEAGMPQCLFCTHEPTVISDWKRFQDAMAKHHGIDIHDAPVPDWLRDQPRG